MSMLSRQLRPASASVLAARVASQEASAARDITAAFAAAEVAQVEAESARADVMLLRAEIDQASERADHAVRAIARLEAVHQQLTSMLEAEQDRNRQISAELNNLNAALVQRDRTASERARTTHRSCCLM